MDNGKTNAAAAFIDTTHPRFATKGASFLVKARSSSPWYLRLDTMHNIWCFLVLARLKSIEVSQTSLLKSMQNSTNYYCGHSRCRTDDLVNGFDINATLGFDGSVPDCHAEQCNTQVLFLLRVHLSRFVIRYQSVAAIATAYTTLLLQRELASAAILHSQQLEDRLSIYHTSIKHSSRLGIQFGWKKYLILTAVFLLLTMLSVACGQI